MPHDVMPAAPGADKDPADCLAIGDALRHLLPALERFVAHEPPGPHQPYRSGDIASEALAIPEQGAGLTAMLDELAAAVDSGCRISAPGFLGYITTGATTAGAAAQTAAAVAGGQRYFLHGFHALEWTALRWLAELCELPPGVTGVFTSGGSTANLLALGAARQAAFERIGVDVASEGLPAGRPTRIYASEHANRTIHRSAAVLGLGRGGVRGIPTDPQGRMDVAALEGAVAADVADGVLPVAVVAIAGTTDTGAVDPVDRVIEVARRHGCWVHVDGAYGLVARALPAAAPLFAGVEDADSWIVDPHKWLATGLGVGATFVRDGGLLTRAFAEGEAAYLQGALGPPEEAARSQFDAIGSIWMDQSVELSSPPRGVMVWAVLREIGRSGVRQRLERDIGFAQTVAERVRADDRLELLCEPQLSIVCFRYRPRTGGGNLDGLNARILQRLRQETPFVPTSTVVGGAFALRPCFTNPRTTRAEVDGLLDAVLALGDALAAADGG